jgi:oligopeptidase B
MTDLTQKPPPPIAEPRPHRYEIHGDSCRDDYHWLRERDNAEMLAYLEAENAYTDAMMAESKTLQTTLYEEMRGRVREADLSVPEQVDDYFYYSRTEKGRQYPIYCRRQGSLEGDEEILLDQNKLAEGRSYTAVGNYRVSPDHRLLAYAVDFAGNEHYTLFVKDLSTGELLSDVIPDTYYGLEWDAAGHVLFYTTLDSATRPFRVLRHRLRDDPAGDVVVLTEPDERYFVTVRKSKNGRYVLIRLRSAMTHEEWFIPADHAEAAPIVIQPRRQGLEYGVEHHGDSFYIVTNDQAVDFRLMVAPVSAPGIEQWCEVIAQEPGAKLERVEPFRDHLVIHLRSGGLKQLRIMEFAEDGRPSGDQHEIAFPEPVYTIAGNRNPNFNSRLVRLTYSSLTTPKTVYDYDMSERSLVVRKREEVLGGYDPSAYFSERQWATADDGTRVPISLVYRRDLRREGGNPLWLYGYGSYGATMEPGFNANRLSLLDRGFIYAIAHIRGGGEMGRAWYEQGKLMAKKSTFSDFVACADFLVDGGYTSPDRLVISGRSAGGLLMGAVVNLRPELFAAVIAGVPFVDVINTMLDPTIPLTVTEYEEWGNPNERDAYAYMKSYSPYDNLAAVDYPHILATAGLNDPRVQYWEPAKWVAKLRTLKTDERQLLLKTNMAAGHGGASGRFDYLEELAFEYAFALDALAIG